MPTTGVSAERWWLTSMSISSSIDGVPPLGFMVRSEGVRIWRDFNGLRCSDKKIGAFPADKYYSGRVI
jgi:hypothetical protein